ncbi:MAG TPA: sodium-translocating pyrophosphatase [Herpetosiphonaceae bacterium]|jgi:K(+)-stimulated pyrophosphate-energized sodium pump|nr:sodium-translocating pyrophosphatase [Herpetosiphonaceae bacterium]
MLRGLIGLSLFEQVAVWTVLVIAVLSLVYSGLLRRQILAGDTGTDEMRKYWGYIRAGAKAYLGQQLRTISIAIVVLTILLFLSVLIIPPSPQSRQVWGANATIAVAIGRSLAFLIGASFSYLVGAIGMNVAVQSNIRVAAASRKTYNGAMQTAYRSGTITGMLCVGLGLLGGTIIFLFYGVSAPDALLGFGFGGSLIALFMRVGGGIYTKAADVGADLVGKVEAGLPEDDPRNAAVIADLVGDNVGDCAGMAADVFESFEVTIVSALILGIVLGGINVANGGSFDFRYLIFPLIARGIGVVASAIGNLMVRTDETRRNAMSAMNRGFYASAALATLGFFLVTVFYMHDAQGRIEWGPFLATFSGIILCVVLDKVTEYFTSTHFQPVQEISRASQTGSATNILSGLALGYESSVYAVLVIAVSILASVFFFGGYARPFEAVLYGVSLTGIGMLTLTGNTISMDAFGPISDNANGIGELAGLERSARDIMDDLDATGNTTKAITKGVAIGSAVIAAVSLYGSFFTDVGIVQRELKLPVIATINVANPQIFIGLLIGGALPFLFSSLTIRAVSRAASLIVNEVRRQLRIPGLMEGTVTPDYARAVAICTTAAQRELITLGVIAVVVPIVVGFLLNIEALGGFLAGTILSGQLLAVFMSNAGGAWDNAKKYIEEGNYGGKGSEPHKAGVVGDTVGDPLKDTSGPALNPLLKVINLISLLIAPIIVTIRRNESLNPVLALGMIALIIVVAFAVYRSKREADDLTGGGDAGMGGSGDGYRQRHEAEERTERVRV